jgi:hypothetical protein
MMPMCRCADRRSSECNFGKRVAADRPSMLPYLVREVQAGGRLKTVNIPKQSKKLEMLYEFTHSDEP